MSGVADSPGMNDAGSARSTRRIRSTPRARRASAVAQPAGPAPRIRTSNAPSPTFQVLPRQGALARDVAVLLAASGRLEDDEAEILPLLDHLDVERELHVGGIELMEIHADPGHLRAAVLTGRHDGRVREGDRLGVGLDGFPPLRR